MDQSNQGLQPAGIIHKEHILAMSWNIATEPKLYRELAPNPYSPRALQIISERFHGSSTTDIIRAVVLAEPEGGYDRDFGLLGIKEQKEELRKQRDVTAGINKHLVQFCNKHAIEFNLLPKEFVYDSLSKVVFGEANLKQIEQTYAQKQRQDFRLEIVNFIEGKQKDPVWGRPLLKAAFITLSFMLIFYLANGLYQKQVEQTYAQNQKQDFRLAIQNQKESQKLPVRLKIPSINVDATIEYVGITSEGAMEVPNNTANAGWFKLGPRPGDKGSAVIAGHFNGENGQVGVFTDLYKLKEGDKLYIEDDKGKITTFIVRESRIYNPGYAEEVFSSSDGAHLNLVTCDGVWDKNKKIYTKRLVIFTDEWHL